MQHNVSICVRAGLPKPRAVPDTERNKDTKKLDYTSTPLDANTLLCVRAPLQSIHEPHGLESFGCARARVAFKLVWREQHSESH